MIRCVPAALLACVLLPCRATLAQSDGVRVLDAMDDPSLWNVVTPEGVRLQVHPESSGGVTCLRLDYEFVTGGGYCILQKPIALTLPENYELSFRVRGEGPGNNLEFKLVDKSGDSVWWVNRRAYEWPREWTRLSNKKRKFEFAWGPSGGAPLREISAIEFAIASSEGGKGSVWLDDLVLREMPTDAAGASTEWRATSSDSRSGHDARLVLDGDPKTYWESESARAWLTFDFGKPGEFAAIEIHWAPANGLSVVDVDASDDGVSWFNLCERHPVRSALSMLLTPDAEARYVRIRGGDATTEVAQGEHQSAGRGVAIAEVVFRPANFSETINSPWKHLARESPRGAYPKYLLNEASYWTVVGEDVGQGAQSGLEEALINEEGQVEVGKRLFSIEPFLSVDGSVLTWNDGVHTQSLADGAMPIPTVTREHDQVRLDVTAWTETSMEVPWLLLRYVVTNISERDIQGGLHLCIRPFQVNPTWQNLNFEGGFSPVRRIEPIWRSSGAEHESLSRVRVHGARTSRDVCVIRGDARLHVLPSDRADVLAQLPARGPVSREAVESRQGTLSAAFGQDFRLAPGASDEIVLGVPMVEVASGSTVPEFRFSDNMPTQAAIAGAVRRWHERTGHVRLIVPKADAWLSETFRAQQAYILINRDGPAFQPGSRTYERSWARDGSLTSAAMLACGYMDEARAWVDWFGSHQFDNGKIPCVVDSRGPDPVPEHDSHGQYIWAVANVHRHTRDREFLTRHWPRVRKTVEYIQSLRAQRGEEYRLSDDLMKRAMYGLVPESISHEGYSAKPMHSYWDDFFVLLGFKSASYIAEEMGEWEYAQSYAKLAAEFRSCLYQSMRLVFERTGIDYIPGCVELADFDSTSTTIALYPSDEQDHVPQQQLARTFDKYWTFAKGRIDGNGTGTPSEWEGMTPYELRHVGAFVRLNQPERAHELLKWFHTLQRPREWRHWAEVVWRDPTTAKFIGDMPHTWVGSDFLNSVLSMFVFEHQDALVLFAGVSEEWIRSGEPLGVEGVHTPYGTLSTTMQRVGDVVKVRVEGQIRAPGRGVIVRTPFGAGSDVVVRSLPAEFEYQLRGSGVSGEEPSP